MPALKDCNEPFDETTRDLLQDDVAMIQIDKDPEYMKIAIVGGGVAGLVAARVLKAQGFNLTLYEAGPAVAGVWSQGYPGFGIQTPGKLYEFPDKELAVPKDYKSGPAIQAYCQEYCNEHQLNGIIHLDTKVTSIAGKKTLTGRQWQISTTSKDGKMVTKAFDFCLLATGVYSPNLKYIPPIEGKEFFSGKICHSQDSGSHDSRKGKKVLVVGFGKSGHDCAMNAFNETGVPPTLLFRDAHWCVPRKVLGLIPMEWLIYSRFGQGTLPKWQECGPVEAVVQSVFYPLIWAYWRIVELLFSAQFGLYGRSSHLRPTLPIEKDMYCGHGVIAHPQVFPMIHKGEIQAVKGSIKCILPSGKIQLDVGMQIEADEIVFATGFKRAYDFLPHDLLSMKEDDGFYSYRNMLVPGVPNIAFLNSNITTFSNITTPGLQAAWLAELLKGEISLPVNIKELVEKEKNWRREKLTYAGQSRAYLVQLHQIRYWDSLLGDIGANVKRKTSIFPPLAALKVFFMPVESSDYKEIVTGEFKDSENNPKGYTPSYLLEWIMIGLILAGIYSLMMVL